MDLRETVAWLIDAVGQPGACDYLRARADEPAAQFLLRVAQRLNEEPPREPFPPDGITRPSDLSRRSDPSGP